MPHPATNVRLPEPLLRDLRARARREGRPMAALLRDAIERYLRPAGVAPPLAGWIGSFDSGVRDLGARHDDYLYGSTSHAPTAGRHQRAGRPRR